MLFGDSFITRHLFPSLATRVLCRPMPFADTSLTDFVRAIFVVAYLDFRSMPFADSPVYCSLCAIFMVAFFDFDLRSMPDADSSFLDKAGAPQTTATFALCPMLVTDSSLMALFVHPLLLQILHFAPCLMQTPPLVALLEQPSRLQSFFVAPCLLHTLPPTAILLHPPAEHPLRHCFFAGAFSTSSDDLFLLHGIYRLHAFDNINCGRISKRRPSRMEMPTSMVDDI